MRTSGDASHTFLFRRVWTMDCSELPLSATPAELLVASMAAKTISAHSASSHSLGRNYIAFDVLFLVSWYLIKATFPRYFLRDAPTSFSSICSRLCEVYFCADDGIVTTHLTKPSVFTQPHSLALFQTRVSTVPFWLRAAWLSSYSVTCLIKDTQFYMNCVSLIRQVTVSSSKQRAAQKDFERETVIVRFPSLFTVFFGPLKPSVWTLFRS